MEKRIIKTTQLKGLRPLFNNRTESIQRFHEIARFFQDTKDYLVFSEPTITPNSIDDSIDWQTEFEGDVTEYQNLAEDDKKIARGILKRQLNNLYNTAYYYTQDPKNRKRILSILDNAIEIPEINNIFLIRDANNRTNVVITAWGFIGEAFNAPSGLIKNLVPVKVKDITLEFVYTNNRPAPNEKVHINFLGKDRELVTDEYGKIPIYDLPFDEQMEIYQLVEGEKKSIHHIKCGRENTYKIKLEREGMLPAMHFVVKDTEGNFLTGEAFVFEHASKKETQISATDGSIDLSEVKENESVKCYQLLGDNIYNKHNFVFNPDENNYEIIITERPKDPKRIIVQSLKGKAIRNAKVELSIAGKQKSFRANKDGYVYLDEVEAGTSILVKAKKGFNKKEESFEIKEEQDEYIIQMKTGAPLWFWLLLIFLAAAIGFAVWWFFFKPPPAPKHATVHIILQDSLSGKTIQNAKLDLSSGNSYNQFHLTNEIGKAEFSLIPPNKEKPFLLKIDAKNYEKTHKKLWIKTDEPEVKIVKVLSLDDGGLMGETGDLKINLKWFTTDDLDLYVHDPCGNKIYYNKRRQNCKSNVGELDIDANGSTSPKLTKKPQENIFWEKATEGMYKIYVQNNKSRTGLAVRYILTIKNKDRTIIRKGQVDKPGVMKFIATTAF